MKQKPVKTILKGFTIGSSMLIPGVSGGTMAMMLNIYSDLIASINSIKKDFKNNAKFLIFFCIGAVSGMILLAKPLSFLVNTFELQMMYLFIGAIAGSIPLIYHQSGTRRVSFKTVLYPIIGMSIILLLEFLPENLFPETTAGGFMGFLGLFIAGFVAAVALILPGISLSHMLLLMGLYAPTMNAISTFNILYLIPLAVGLLFGIFLTTKTLDKLMSRHTEATFLIILGFIIGSVIDVFPKVFPEGLNLLLCLALFTVGFFAMYKLSSFEK